MPTSTTAAVTRRTLLGGLAGASLATLAACSGSSAAKGGSVPTQSPGASGAPVQGSTNLNVYCWTNGPSVDANFKHRIEMFNQAYAGRFTAKLTLLPYDQYWQKAQLQYAANKPFDIYFWDVQAYAHYKKGLIEDLQPMINATALNNADLYPTKLFDPWRFDGKDMYGVPDDIQSMSLFYNKDHFDEAGLKYPDATTSWDQILEYAGKLQKSSGGKVTRWGLDIGDLGVWWGIQSLSWAAGTAWVDKPLEPTKFLLDDPKNIESLKFVQDLMWAKHIAPRPAERDALSQGGGGFQSGAVSMTPVGTWNIAGYQQMKSKWAMTSLPLYQGKSVSPYWLGGWVIPKKSAALTAAQTFATWSAIEFQPQMAKDHDWIPVSNEARNGSAMSAGMPQGFTDAMKAIPDARIGDIYTNNMQEIFNEVFGPALDDLLNNRKTPEQVAQKIQTDGTAKLS